MIFGINRPVRLAVSHRIPGQAGGPRAGLLLALIAIAAAVGVASFGFVTDRTSVTVVGLASSLAITVAMAVGVRDSIRAAELSAAMLDQALAESERARDELYVANERLQRTNVSLRTLQVAVAQGFNLIDERTQGRLRELVEEAGDDLAALVGETIDDESRR